MGPTLTAPWCPLTPPPLPSPRLLILDTSDMSSPLAMLTTHTLLLDSPTAWLPMLTALLSPLTPLRSTLPRLPMPLLEELSTLLECTVLPMLVSLPTPTVLLSLSSLPMLLPPVPSTSPLMPKNHLVCCFYLLELHHSPVEDLRVLFKLNEIFLKFYQKIKMKNPID